MVILYSACAGVFSREVSWHRWRDLVGDSSTFDVLADKPVSLLELSCDRCSDGLCICGDVTRFRGAAWPLDVDMLSRLLEFASSRIESQPLIVRRTL